MTTSFEDRILSERSKLRGSVRRPDQAGAGQRPGGAQSSDPGKNYRL